MSSASLEPPTLDKPTFEHHPTGLGIGIPRPRISWRFKSSETTAPAWIQTAYEIEVRQNSQGSPQTFRFQGPQSILVPWPCDALQSRESAQVRVRSFGTSHGEDIGPTEWSPLAIVEIGLLNKSDWKSSFITAATRIGPDGPLQPLRFRKEFTLSANLRAGFKARLYITALGVFEAYVDGKPASDECMAPGWTSYNHRLNYRVWDVASLFENGVGVGEGESKHTLCVEVGEGWYATRLGFRGGRRFQYGEEIGLLAQLEIDYGDGEERWTLGTDDTWICTASAIQTSELYDGEVYDARKEISDWNRVSHNPSSYTKTKSLPWPATTQLVSPISPPVRITEQKRPVKIFKSPSGKTIVDFGQNLVGKLLIKQLHVPAGQEVTFRHAEVLEHDELGTRPLRFAHATDTIISSGEPLRDWTPKFTFHGFRYAQVDGWDPTEDTIVALVMHSAMTRRGYFSCSNSAVNQLHSNVVWSMRGNFLSIPTDCPQRDERLGWTGDIQIFTPTASFLYDSIGFLSDWLQDLQAEQLREGQGGIPPLVCPILEPLGNWPHIPQAVWDDVTVLTPAELHRYSSDSAILERQMDGMRAWLDQGVDRGPDGLWNPERWQLGDWLDPAAPPDDPGLARTDGVFVADAYLVHVTRTMARVCRLLGKDGLAEKYKSDAEELLHKFQHRYITAEGLVAGGNTQTAVALAILFGLYEGRDGEAIDGAARQLAKLVRLSKFRIGTGFAGTPAICHALTAAAHPQLAYRMLLEKSCPSWLYPVTMGATTIWERWDSMRPDGTINPGEMTSFNHYALGSVADWLHTTVGGISPIHGEVEKSNADVTSGWKVFRVRPVPGGNLTWAEVKFDGPYGTVECSWKLSDLEGSSDAATTSKKFQMTLIVPPNSSALLTLPSDIRKKASDLEEKTQVVQSGTHHFQCTWKADEWPPKPLLSANKRDFEDHIAV